MNAPTRFCIVSDDDGHNYVIPAGKKEAWDRFCDGDKTDGNYELGDLPEWATELGYPPCYVTFTDWRIDK